MCDYQPPSIPSAPAIIVATFAVIGFLTTLCGLAWVVQKAWEVWL